jgi:hypothetical protein
MITNAVFNITSDIMIMIIPMPVLLKSQLPKRRKVVLCGVFALGAFSVSLPQPLGFWTMIERPRWLGFQTNGS